ncbi:CRP-like cAMP-binding protein [Kibdelosporangium banguiense]|uniref:CRP-like cAMP-binding protein n=1 Tax=Kibdelosporangium banguiense TaxID=1365924 RepID=A0ABS4TE74_9PSEU|nr:Crp/Fnr family transcriptional regulator [Kibdelosporangium banguiense]MBP2322656.1 CRP-like cAMP-binding protein [Kibdelosporangium banguiense]
MSLNDRLRGAAEALIAASTRDHDLEHGTQLLHKAYQTFRPTASQSTAPIWDDQDVDDETAYRMGTVSAERGDWHGAALCFHQAAVHDFGDAALRLGDVLEQLGRLDEATQWYRQAEQSGLSEASGKLAALTTVKQEPKDSAAQPSTNLSACKPSQAVIPMGPTTSQPSAEKQDADTAPILPLVARDRRATKEVLPGMSFPAAAPSKTWEYYSGTSLALDESSSEGRDQGSSPYPPASLLGRLTNRTREDFLVIGVSESRPAGARIISQGESDSNALLLLHGSVKVIATNSAGERTLLAIRTGGDLIGEMAALDVGPRSATVITCTDVFFKRMTRAELRNFLARHPDAAIEVATMLSERLRWSDRRRIEHGRPASVRVAQVLVDLYEAYGTRVGNRWNLSMPLTREELASIAGIKMTTAEKIIRSFQQEGLVSGRYRDFSILDMSRLRLRAEVL